jgi:hypothetical protein
MAGIRIKNCAPTFSGIGFRAPENECHEGLLTHLAFNEFLALAKPNQEDLDYTF